VVRSAALAALVAIVAALVVTTGGPARPRDAHPTEEAGGPPFAMSASATTTTESSIAIAMGHLHDPTNTFWELFLKPASETSWTLQTPPGVASNGGLVVAALPLTVGFVASADLKFSPIAQSADGGHIWSPGELPSPLTTAPDALAVGPNGDVLAIVGGAGQRVLETSGSGQLSAWRTAFSMKSPGADTSTCDVGEVTAVSFTAASQPLLGLQCGHAETIGILAADTSSPSPQSGWHIIGPPLDADARDVSVIRLLRTPDDLAGLAQALWRTGSSIVAFWGDGTTDQWSRPIPFRVPPGWSVKATATGGEAGQGLAVLMGSGAKRRVEVITGPGASWATLPLAAQNASGVSYVGAEIDTFVVTSSRLTVWAWTSGAAGWRRTAVIHVPVPYGSSS
jgi:hypothetical protein